MLIIVPTWIVYEFVLDCVDIILQVSTTTLSSLAHLYNLFICRRMHILLLLCVRWGGGLYKEVLQKHALWKPAATHGNRNVTQHQRRLRIHLGLFPNLHIHNASGLGLQRGISLVATLHINKAGMQVGGRHRRCAH